LAVQGVSILAFLNPIILTAFCAAFLLVYSKNVERKSALWFALAYGVCAIGFLVDFLRDLFPPIAISLATNTLFMLTMSATVMGLAARFERKAPLVTMALCALSGYAVVLWFFFIEVNISHRTIGINMALGALSLSGFAMIWPLRLTGIDRALRAVFGIVCLQFFLRTFLVFWLSPDPINQAHYLASPYAVTLQFTVAVVSMAFAAALLAAVIQDHLRDLRQESASDPLSALLNRRGFDEAAAAAMRGGGGALLIADIDRFKRINDCYGHSGGDVVIAAFGALLQTLFSEAAVAGRVGGEEFAVFFPRASLGDAVLHAEKARRTLASLTLPGVLAAERITASFGVEAWEYLSEAMGRADRALYGAKRGGRNRTEIFHDATPDEPTRGAPGLFAAARAA
jgi:diguanylate cyclase (GGDEF)-like protein